MEDKKMDIEEQIEDKPERSGNTGFFIGFLTALKDILFGEKNIFIRTSEWVAWFVRFVTYDIWRLTENDMSGMKSAYIHVIRTINLAIRGFVRDEIDTRASALTYSTILAIVPLLAVIVGVATGFGMRETIRTSLYT
jgi:membrane protein